MVSGHSYRTLRSALIREGDYREHGALLLAKPLGDAQIEVTHVELFGPTDFVQQSHGYIELREDALQEMILRAHQRRNALIEAHSHPFSKSPHVGFSPFDEAGLSEVAPHVVWRLPGRAYTALVFGQQGFDGLFWRTTDATPSGAVDLVVDGERLLGSGESLLRWGGMR